MPRWGFDPIWSPPYGETENVADTDAWYRDLFVPKPRPLRLIGDHKQEWGFLSDEVDPRVREMIEKLCRGNRKRVLSQFHTHLSLDVRYRCLEGDSVGESIAVDFETAFGEWLHRPNFDAPPCPPPAEAKELGTWVKNYVGTCGWLAEQTNLREIDVRNALAGRSKKHLPPIMEFAARFFAVRVAMDVLNENFEAEMAEYEREMKGHTWQVYGHAKELYYDACQAWAASEEKKELDRFVARGGDRWEFIGQLHRDRVPEMETHKFRSWCEVNWRLIWNSIPYRTPQRPRQWEMMPMMWRIEPEAHQ